MYNKIIKNDIKKNKLITITITAFILLASLLISIAISLSVNLFSSIDHFMDESKTPHFLQMHSGEIDMDRLHNFIDKHNNIEASQVQEFLNIEGAEILLGESSLAGSVQDNGLSVQSENFDFLLGLDDNIIYPADGEIYVPLYYMKQEQINVGDQITIHGVTFTVAGFLRDSIMNPSLVSSKRFLVSRNDFEKVREFGMLEYLIEFRLKDISSLPVFEADYSAANLEAKGPPDLTYSLVKLANASTDGMMIAVLMLISILVIIVTFLCIRFTLLAKIEEDYKEIGVLKAIGLRVSNIKKLYMAKYGAIAAIACILGFLLSILLQDPLMENIHLYMGKSDQFLLSLVLGIIGAALIFFVVILYVHGVLRRFHKISAAEAIRFGAPQEKFKAFKGFYLSKNKLFSSNTFLAIKDILSRKKLYVTMLLVLVISLFIMIVPQNIYNTISSRNFITYMGIGDCHMRLDIQQVDDIRGKSNQIASALAKDDRVSKYTILTSMAFDMNMDDGTVQRLKVELGDPHVFPIEYGKGNAPSAENDIAISTLVAEDIEKTVGDEITLVVDNEEKHLTICGIYSDITNAGKTAKAIFQSERNDILWSTIPIELHDSNLTKQVVSEFKEKTPYARVSNVDDYINQTFGPTLSAIEKAAYVSIGVAILLTILVTILFMKMLVTKDRYSISILKALGFKNADIRKQYVARSIFILAIGVVVGTFLSNTLGELVGVTFISSFGVSTFHFQINPLYAYLFSPFAIAASVYFATISGVSDIRSIKIPEFIKE